MMRALAALVLCSACGLDTTVDFQAPPIGLDGGTPDASSGPDVPGSDGIGDLDAGVEDTRTPDIVGMDVPGCAVPPSCSSSMSTYCEGGAPITVPCPLGCGPDGRCSDFTPSNVSPTFFSEGRGGETVSGEWNTSLCEEIPVGTARNRSQGEGPTVCVVAVGSLLIPDGETLRVMGNKPLVILAEGPVQVLGDIDLAARGTMAGPGGWNGGTRSEPTMLLGPSPGGRGNNDSHDDGGGGGGGFCGAGGAGGRGGDEAGGPGGLAVMTNFLQPLDGGSGGGVGGDGESAASGGAGGGALQISSRVRIQVAGRIDVGGGGGNGGGDGTSDDYNIGAGGGGGSGGAILLEAPSLQVTGELLAAGGGGGGSAGCRTEGDGSPGEDGAGRAQAAGGQRGRDCDWGANYGSSGSRGGGLTETGGTAGGANDRNEGNGGGGGGGGGCVVLRGEVRMTGGSTISPSIAPTFVEAGLL